MNLITSYKRTQPPEELKENTKKNKLDNIYHKIIN